VKLKQDGVIESIGGEQLHDFRQCATFEITEAFRDAIEKSLDLIGFLPGDQKNDQLQKQRMEELKKRRPEWTKPTEMIISSGKRRSNWDDML